MGNLVAARLVTTGFHTLSVGLLPSARNGPQLMEVNIKMLRRIVAPSRLSAAAVLRGNKPAALGPRARFLSEGPPNSSSDTYAGTARFAIDKVFDLARKRAILYAAAGFGVLATYAYKYRWSKQAVLEDILQTFEAGGKPGWQERYSAESDF